MSDGIGRFMLSNSWGECFRRLLSNNGVFGGIIVELQMTHDPYELTQVSKFHIICRHTTYRTATYKGKSMTHQLAADKHTPLTETTFFILLSLAPEPKHGYAIMKEVQQLSEGRVVLSTGTLYGAIKRLLEHGWIQRVEVTETNKLAAGRKKKSYSLSDSGRRALNAEIARLETLIHLAQAQTLGARP